MIERVGAALLQVQGNHSKTQLSVSLLLDWTEITQNLGFDNIALSSLPEIHLGKQETAADSGNLCGTLGKVKLLREEILC